LLDDRLRPSDRRVPLCSRLNSPCHNAPQTPNDSEKPGQAAAATFELVTYLQTCLIKDAIRLSVQNQIDMRKVHDVVNVAEIGAVSGFRSATQGIADGEEHVSARQLIRPERVPR
jgi:hypothetical protein